MAEIRLIWTTLLLFVAFFVGLSRSPYVAIFSLILITIGLRFKTGALLRSWFFFTLVIVYLGGIIVMFVYLRSLIQSAKISTPGTQYGVLVGAGLALLTVSSSLLSIDQKEQVWVDRGFSYSNAPLVVFMVVYLLVALISVYRLCEKREGPIKGAR